ncbi:MAG: S8 family serine peptidase [Arenicellales bacterium]|nr:S8 family serine peptidase [Arenicellales bacterium]
MSAFSEGDCGGCVDPVGQGDTSGSTEGGNTTEITVPTPSPDFLGIAVVDTGVQLRAPMSTQTLLPGSRSFAGGSPLTDSAQHGTVVAQLILSLAPQSKILSVKTSNGGRSVSTSSFYQGLLYATSIPSIRVINHSNAALARVPRNAMLAVAAAGKVIVMQAGNDQAASPRGDALYAPILGGKALIVGGLNPNGRLYGRGNRAGSYASHYVVALAGSRFSRSWGTSFAVPRASALAARLFQTWPNLKAAEVVDIIKRSATDMGTPGVDAVYGWGRINFVRAFQPLGPVTPPPSGPTDSKKEPDEIDDPVEDDYGAKRLRLSPAIYSAIAQQGLFSQAVVVDRYDRDFRLNVAALSSVRDDKARARQILHRWSQESTADILSEGLGYRLLSYRHAGYSTAGDVEPALGFDTKIGDHYTIRLGYNSRPTPDTDAVYWLQENHFAAPAGAAWDQGLIGQYSDEGVHSQGTYQINPLWRLGFNMAKVDSEGDTAHDSQQLNVVSHFGGSGWGFALEGGLLNESGSLLGGSVGGALSVRDAQTRSGRLTAYRRLDQNWALIGAYTEGLTQVTDRPGGLLGDFSTLASNAWLIGLSAKDLFSPADTASVSISQPLRAFAGDAALDIAYDLSAQGQVLRHQQRVSLAPGGVETLLEFVYSRPITSKLTLGSYFALRDQPNHDRLAGLQMHWMGVVQGSF